MIKLLLAGIHVHLYKGRLLHAKHVTFDDEIALLGSSNVDIRSFVLNAEISFVAFDRGVTAQLRGEQIRCFGASETLILDAWEKRMIAHKICENLARLAGPLL